MTDGKTYSYGNLGLSQPLQPIDFNTDGLLVNAYERYLHGYAR